MAYVEFTIEPFVEGHPGPHVIAAVDAVRARDVDVEFGPFGTSCTVELGSVGALVGSFTDAAMAHGATHVSVHIALTDPWTPGTTGGGDQ